MLQHTVNLGCLGVVWVSCGSSTLGGAGGVSAQWAADTGSDGELKNCQRKLAAIKFRSQTQRELLLNGTSHRDSLTHTWHSTALRLQIQISAGLTRSTSWPAQSVPPWEVTATAIEIPRRHRSAAEPISCLWERGSAETRIASECSPAGGIGTSSRHQTHNPKLATPTRGLTQPNPQPS